MNSADFKSHRIKGIGTGVCKVNWRMPMLSDPRLFLSGCGA